MRYCRVIGYYSAFRRTIPVSRVRYPSIPHPFATNLRPEGLSPFDLHALATPPAFVLSQDQTLQLNPDSFSFTTNRLRDQSERRVGDFFRLSQHIAFRKVERVHPFRLTNQDAQRPKRRVTLRSKTRMNATPDLLKAGRFHPPWSLNAPRRDRTTSRRHLPVYLSKNLPIRTVG